MAFIDNHQIDVADFFRSIADGLDAGKCYRLLQLLSPQAGGKDTKRRSGPVLEHFLSVLLNQLLDVCQHQNARLGIVLQGPLAEGRDDVALA